MGKSTKTCKYCDATVLARGMCPAHYQRERRNGTVQAAVPIKVTARPGEPEAKIDEVVDQTQRAVLPDDCIEWPYGTSHGQPMFQERCVRRVLLERLEYPVPMRIKQDCDNPSCINPKCFS